MLCSSTLHYDDRIFDWQYKRTLPKPNNYTWHKWKQQQLQQMISVSSFTSMHSYPSTTLPPPPGDETNEVDESIFESLSRSTVRYLLFLQLRSVVIGRDRVSALLTYGSTSAWGLSPSLVFLEQFIFTGHEFENPVFLHKYKNHFYFRANVSTIFHSGVVMKY